MTRSFLLAFLFLLAASCGQTPGAFVEIPFEGQGTAAETFTKDGWEVTLKEATLGFGSIFFCATDTSNSSSRASPMTASGTS